MKRNFLAAAIGQILIDHQMKNAEGEAEMTRMFMMDEQQHAQVCMYLKDFSSTVGYPNGTYAIELDEALAMLKAMQPVSLVAWQYKTNEAGLFVSDQCPADVEVWNDIEWSKPLYTPEQSK